MLVHKGGQINNVQLITGLRIAEMSQRQGGGGICKKHGSYCEKEKSHGEGVRVDVNGEVKLLRKLKKNYFFFFWSGGGGGGSG